MPTINKGNKCSLCDEKSMARGYCQKHYQRWRRHGDPHKINRPIDWGSKGLFHNRVREARESIYSELFEEQQGLCAICREPEITKSASGKQRPLAIDHCHETGAIRGLLCTYCNTALGSMKDNPEVLLRAIVYLRDHGSKPREIDEKPFDVPKSECSVAECDRLHYGHGYCRRHYKRFIRYGNVDPIHCENCGAQLSDDAVRTKKFCNVACKMQHHRKNGCYTEEALKDAIPCSVDGCDRPHQAKGMCRRHYMREWHKENPR